MYRNVPIYFQLVEENPWLSFVKYHFLVSTYRKQVSFEFCYCFQGRIPLDPRLTACLEEGKSYVDTYMGAPAQKAMADIVQKVLSETDHERSKTVSKMDDNS